MVYEKFKQFETISEILTFLFLDHNFQNNWNLKKISNKVPLANYLCLKELLSRSDSIKQKWWQKTKTSK